MFGCIVSNAMTELVQWADAHPSERLFRCALQFRATGTHGHARPFCHLYNMIQSRASSQFGVRKRSSCGFLSSSPRGALSSFVIIGACDCRATERCTAGIIQTMHHFGKVPEDSSLPPKARAFRALAEVYFFAMAWRNATVANDSGAPAPSLHFPIEFLQGSQGAMARSCSHSHGAWHVLFATASEPV